jgi:polysaccharide deacetylase family protein (PEP-CTERM system associated)
MKSVTLHHFTVDVEEYFQVSAFENAVPRERWNTLPSRVEPSMRLLADMLAKHETKATLFILGWVAERRPDLVKELAAAGHEIASHGWDHRRVTTQTPEEFRASVRRTKALLEDQTGRAVYGFRAPSYSIVPGREWALDILLEEGYRYDSSLFPIRRRGYGFPGGQRDPHWLKRPAGLLGEVPPATLRWGRATLPAGGGAYFRLLPYSLVKAAFAQAEQRQVPATFYTHPWEIDADQPRMPVSALTRVRHYGGLGRMLPRLERLLASYRFCTIAETLSLHSSPQVA